MSFQNELETGVYEKKQLLSKSRLIAWSHRSRFEFGLDQVRAFGGRSILDYGCGDGVFLKSLNGAYEKCVGVDISTNFINDCRLRMGSRPGYDFLMVDELEAHYGPESFDVITCMETLEHCTTDTVDEILLKCRRLLKPDGLLLISVPIEVGPSLLAKQLGRMISGLRNIGDYRLAFENYTLPEMVTMTFANEKSTIRRPYAVDQDSAYGHKGFNWMSLKKQVQNYFEIENKNFTPLPATGSFLNSQAWFRCSISKARP